MVKYFEGKYNFLNQIDILLHTLPKDDKFENNKFRFRLFTHSFKYEMILEIFPTYVKFPH